MTDSEIMEFEENTFGESYIKPEDINPEKVVNLLAYYYGQELLEDIFNEYKENN